MDEVDAILGQLERGELGDATAVLAYLAGRHVELPDDELSPARRRSVLLLAAGGDPQRELSVDDRAVKALATELWSDGRRAALASGLDDVVMRARSLPGVREVAVRLAGDLDLAWRLFTLTLIAEELGDDELP
jgi:hypothetical protein